MRWHNETGGIIQNWATDLSSTPLPFSSAFKLWTASTSHSRSQRVLLPVRRRFPRHSSTPTTRKHQFSFLWQKLYIQDISIEAALVMLLCFFPVWWNVMLSWTHEGFCLFVPISPSSASQVIKQRCVLTSQVQTCPRFVAVNRKLSMW